VHMSTRLPPTSSPSSEVTGSKRQAKEFRLAEELFKPSSTTHGKIVSTLGDSSSERDGNEPGVAPSDDESGKREGIGSSLKDIVKSASELKVDSGLLETQRTRNPESSRILSNDAIATAPVDIANLPGVESAPHSASKKSFAEENQDRAKIEDDSLKALESRRTEVFNGVLMYSARDYPNPDFFPFPFQKDRSWREVLLEEMTWMATDFVEEKKWKISLSKQIAEEAILYLRVMRERKLMERGLYDSTIYKSTVSLCRQIKAFWALQKAGCRSARPAGEGAHSRPITSAPMNNICSVENIKSFRPSLDEVALLEKEAHVDLEDILPRGFLEQNSLDHSADESCDDEESDAGGSELQMATQNTYFSHSEDKFKKEFIEDDSLDDSDDAEWNVADGHDSEEEEFFGDDLEEEVDVASVDGFDGEETAREGKQPEIETWARGSGRKRRFAELSELWNDQSTTLSNVLAPYAESACVALSDLLVEKIDGKGDEEESENLTQEMLSNSDLIPSDHESNLILKLIIERTGSLDVLKKYTVEKSSNSKVSMKGKQDHFLLHLPCSLLSHMQDFHLDAIRWMKAMFSLGFHARLNAERGLGCIQTVSALLLELALGNHRNWGGHLIIVPSYIISVWELTLQLLCPQLRVFVLDSWCERKSTSDVPSPFAEGTAHDTGFNICLSSYVYARLHQTKLRRLRWQALVIDSAEKIDDFDHDHVSFLSTISCSWRLLLGSWGSDEEDLLCAKFLLPHPLPGVPDICIAISGNMKKSKAVGKFGSLISSALQASTFSMVMEGVLGCAKNTNLSCEMVPCELGCFQREKYKEVAERALSVVNDIPGKKQKQRSLLQAFCALHYAANHSMLKSPVAKIGGAKDLQVSPFVFRGLTLAMPNRVFDVVADNNGLDIRFFNLSLLDIEINYSNDYTHVCSLRTNAIVREGLRRYRVENEAVEASMFQQDDGGSLVFHVQLQHANLLRRREAVCENIAYINSYRCRRRPLFGLKLRSAVSVERTMPSQNIEIINVLRTRTKCAYTTTERVLSGMHCVRDSGRGALFAPDFGSIPFPTNVRIRPFKYLQQLVKSSSKIGKLSSLLFRKTPTKLVGIRTLVIVGIPQMVQVVRGFLAHRGINYLQLDEDDSGNPCKSLNEWGRSACEFNSNKSWHVAIICGANTTIFPSLTSVPFVDQVIFMDSIEVDSELPDACAHLLDQISVFHREKKLRVLRLYTKGTVEECLLKREDSSVETIVKTGVVLSEESATPVFAHLHDAARISFGSKVPKLAFDETFEDLIAEEQNGMFHINGDIENVTDSLDEINVYLGEKISAIEKDPESSKTDDICSDGPVNSLLYKVRPDSVEETAAIHCWLGKDPRHPTTHYQEKRHKIDHPRFYAFEDSSPVASSGYQTFWASNSVQHDDPKSIAFRKFLEQQANSGNGVDFRMYGRPSCLALTPISGRDDGLDINHLKYSARHFLNVETTGSYKTGHNQTSNDNGSRKRGYSEMSVRNFISDWSPWEDVMMRQAMSAFGPNWDLIADLLNSSPFAESRTRSARQCHARLQTIGAQIFRELKHERQQNVLLSKHLWASKPRCRNELVWNSSKLCAEYHGESCSQSLENNEGEHLLASATMGDRREFVNIFGKVLQAMNEQKSTPPILNESMIKMTSETLLPDISHEKHSVAFSPVWLMEAKKKRRTDGDMVSAVDSTSFSTTKPPINPFNKSSAYTRRMINHRQNGSENPGARNPVGSSYRSAEANPPRRSVLTAPSSSAARDHKDNKEGKNTTSEDIEVERKNRMKKRQRQLQSIIAIAAKHAGMDRAGLQRVAKETPTLKTQIPQIVQRPIDIKEKIRAIAKLLIHAATKVGLKLTLNSHSEQ
jgi:hypothetical protein